MSFCLGHYRSVPVIAALLTAVLFASGCGRPHPDRPNVIIISIGSLRADHLGCYGYGRTTSPNIDSLAGDAFLFEEAYSAANWAAPSDMTMLTSLYPSVHGVNGHPAPGVLGRDIKTLPEYLKASGYYTAGFYYGDDLSPAHGFDRGFDRYERKDFIRPELGEALSLMDSRRSAKAPFFLFMHVGDVHYPYMAASQKDARYAKLYGPDYTGPIKEGGPEEWAALEERLADSDDTSDSPDLRHIVGLYDGAINYTDKYLGELVKGLKDKGLYDDTVIVLLSDHGEEFGEHGRFGHEQVYREGLHVPLIVRFPSWVSERAGYGAPRRIDALAGLIDLVPTLLETLGVEFKSTHEGVSLAGILRGEAAARSTVYAESEQKAKFLHFIKPGERPGATARDKENGTGLYSRLFRSQKTVIGGGYQYLRFSNASNGGPDLSQLFDYRADPEERHDVEPSRQEVAAGLAGELDKAVKQCATARKEAYKQ